MAERAKEAIGVMLVEAEALRPVAKPVEAMTPAELMGETAYQGLRRLHEIVCWAPDPGDLKLSRLIGDMALGANNLLRRAAHEERRVDMIGQLLAELAKSRDGEG